MLMLVNYTDATCTLNQQIYSFDSTYTQLLHVRHDIVYIYRFIVLIDDFLPTAIIALAKPHALELNLLLPYLSKRTLVVSVETFGLLQDENSTGRVSKNDVRFP